MMIWHDSTMIIPTHINYGVSMPKECEYILESGMGGMVRLTYHLLHILDSPFRDPIWRQGSFKG